MDFHGELRSRFQAAVADSCSKRGCVFSLDSLNRRPTVIDADRYAALTGHRGEICDYFVFPATPEILAVAVEMKAGGVDARHAVRQLAAGARVTETMTQGRNVASFYPLLLSQAVGHPSEVKLLGKSKVQFRGRNYPVIRKRCGVKLSAVMPELAAS